MGGAALILIIFGQTFFLFLLESPGSAALSLGGLALTLWISSLGPLAALLALGLLLALIAGLGYRIERLR